MYNDDDDDDDDDSLDGVSIIVILIVTNYTTKLLCNTDIIVNIYGITSYIIHVGITKYYHHYCNIKT